jgi:dTDP-4-amino-4,6-dideoxygalactose transaminase
MFELETGCGEVPGEKRHLFCGPPWAYLGQILGITASHGVASWFQNARTYYVHLGRVAIRYACELLGVGRGDELLVPAYNCGSEIDPLLCSGASLTLYRIDRAARIDLNDLQGRISKKTRAIYVTHYLGMPHGLVEIKELCKDRKIHLIEDCALSLFSSDGETRLGSLGDVSIFSFPKTLPVPDGGAMVINNPALSADSWRRQRPPLLRLSRRMLSLAKRYMLHRSSESGLLYSTLWSLLGTRQLTNNDSCGPDASFPDMPSNFYYDERLNNDDISRITERMLRTFDAVEIRSRRRRNFLRYLDLLSSAEGAELLYRELPEGVCPLHFPIIVPERGRVCRELNALSIDATAWWSGYHRSLPWAEYPDACFLKDHLLVLPVHQGLSDNHIGFICETLLRIIRRRSGDRV